MTSPRKLPMYPVQQPSLARHRWDGCAAMARSWNRIEGRGRRSGGWTSNHGGGWSNSPRNGSRGIRLSRNLGRGKGDKLPILTLSGPNFFHNGGRRWDLVFFRLLLEFVYLQDRRNEVVVKWFLRFGHKSTWTIQVPSTCDQVRTWEFGNLHESVHTMIIPRIEPILKEWRQKRRKNILEDELTVNVPPNWRT